MCCHSQADMTIKRCWLTAFVWVTLLTFICVLLGYLAVEAISQANDPKNICESCLRDENYVQGLEREKQFLTTKLGRCKIELKQYKDRNQKLTDKLKDWRTNTGVSKGADAKMKFDSFQKRIVGLETATGKEIVIYTENVNSKDEKDKKHGFISKNLILYGPKNMYEIGNCWGPIKLTEPIKFEKSLKPIKLKTNSTRYICKCKTELEQDMKYIGIYEPKRITPRITELVKDHHWIPVVYFQIENKSIPKFGFIFLEENSAPNNARIIQFHDLEKFYTIQESQCTPNNGGFFQKCNFFWKKVKDKVFDKNYEFTLADKDKRESKIQFNSEAFENYQKLSTQESDQQAEGNNQFNADHQDL